MVSTCVVLTCGFMLCVFLCHVLSCSCLLAKKKGVKTRMLKYYNPRV